MVSSCDSLIPEFQRFRFIFNSGLFGHFSCFFCFYHVVKWFLLLSDWEKTDRTFTHLSSYVSVFINSRGKYLVILRYVIQLVAN